MAQAENRQQDGGSTNTTRGVVEGKRVTISYFGNAYEGVIDAEYGDAPEGERTVRVIPDGEGPFGRGKPFTGQLSEAEIHEEGDRVGFCPICGSSVTECGDDQYECPTHGEISINFSQ